MNLLFYRQILEYAQISNFMKIRPTGETLFSKRTDIVQTDMTKLRNDFFFLNFANTLKKAMLDAATCSLIQRKLSQKHKLQ